MRLLPKKVEYPFKKAFVGKSKICMHGSVSSCSDYEPRWSAFLKHTQCRQRGHTKKVSQLWRQTQPGQTEEPQDASQGPVCMR